MVRNAKRFFLYGCRLVGLFRLARHLTRSQLRILAYHGFSMADEDRWRPQLFIQPATFARRLACLQRQGYPVLSLSEAVERLKAGTLPPAATVLTIDDGFASTRLRAAELIEKFGFPATIYVTSYYVAHPHPVFRLAVQYLFWKTDRQEIRLDGLGAGLAGRSRLTDAKAVYQIAWDIIDHGETRCNESERMALLGNLARELGIDWEAVVEGRILNLMTPAEIQELAGRGFDIQLHTHRHRFPVDGTIAEREITDNRSFLAPLTGRPLVHFCYPSGQWSPQHGPLLEAAGIHTATTCEPILNDSKAPALALGRFLDSEDVSQIEFEACLSGFWPWVRKLFRR